MWGKVGWSWCLAVLLAGAAIFGGSIAVADVPDGNVINGCRNTSTGALRVIDASAGQNCVAGESALRWTNWRSRGLWYSIFTYQAGDVVSYLGSSYVAKVGSPAGTKPTATAYWDLLAAQGATGAQGLQGLQGLQGPPGVQGLTGATGSVGPAGIQGPVGDVGPAGPQGIAGATGATGPVGPAGIQGPVGDVGPAGPQGIAGATGATGPAGAQGIQGPIGATGPAGAQGIQGPTGPPGPQGIPGVSAVPIFARIDGGGTLLATKHVNSVSYSGVVTKTYTITFDQDVSQCAVAAVSEGQTAIPVITGRAPTTISITFALASGLLTATTFDVTLAC